VEIDISATGGTVVVRGDIDRLVCGHLRSVLSSLVDATGNRVVHLDLSSVSFIDSTGLDVLVGNRRRGLDREVEVVLRSPSAGVLRLLEITGMAKLFAIDNAGSGRDRL
jgi:anti-sigma B factor antagonist